MAENLKTTCCIAGGGPAGMMLGYLLARRGVAVTVLEKHQDFFRDFRGDTVHPSTLELFHELGLLRAFLQLPHQELRTIGGTFGDFRFTAADFSRVPAHCKFIALMPQWDFLDFLAARARKFPHFQLRMNHEIVGLRGAAGRITGVDVQTPGGQAAIHADLVVGCDGRHSVVRRAAQFEVLEFGVPIDVLWFRISRNASDPEQSLGNINYGRALVLINRDEYYQAGLIIEKGSFERMKEAGLGAFRATVQAIAPYVADRVNELQSWDQVKLLTVQINRLRNWHKPGLLCIGDAAHAMSPAGGVGINLAIQDAVATANILSGPLLDGNVDDTHLALVQRRREFPTRVTQFVQMNAHRGLARLFRNPGPIHAPAALRVAVRIPGPQHLIARLVGMGVRPEHITDGPNPPPARLPARTVAAVAALTAFAVAAVFLFRRSRSKQLADAR